MTGYLYHEDWGRQNPERFNCHDIGEMEEQHWESTPPPHGLHSEGHWSGGLPLRGIPTQELQGEAVTRDIGLYKKTFMWANKIVKYCSV